VRHTFFAGLLGMALFTSSCGHTEASPSPAVTDAVMRAIHNYGHDHQSLLFPGSSDKPEETDAAYSAHISIILVQEDFAQLEKIARQNRIEKGRLVGGVWTTLGFYNATGMPVFVGAPKDSDYTQHIARLKRWITAYPDSTAARLSLAYLYLNYASVARGSGFADTVSDSQWSVFYSRDAQAKAILLEASSLKEKDPFWYQAMQLVAHDEGWNKRDARELFNQAVAFEPGYYHYYREYARYLLPQWYGKPGDIQAFAEETAKRVPEPDGSMLYFQIISSLACYCRQAMEDLPHVSYPILRQGYANLTRFYGSSNLTANRFAFMASTFKDKPSAHDAFAVIVTMDSDIWYTKDIFDNSRDWANAP
jgi:hypothetical protein